MEDETEFQSMFRMNAELVGPAIAKQDTLMRESMSASKRLEITLRYLATG